MKIEDSRDRFRYVALGQFIVDCIQNKAYFNFLVKEYLEVDLIQFMEDEKHRNELKEKEKERTSSAMLEVRINAGKGHQLSTQLDAIHESAEFGKEANLTESVNGLRKSESPFDISP